MSCPLCGAQTEAAFTTTDRNRACSTERFEYRRCAACGSYLLADIPADLGRYYPADYYGFPAAHELDKAATLEAPKLELIMRHAARGRLVEIGPGAGAFSPRCAQRRLRGDGDRDGRGVLRIPRARRRGPGDSKRRARPRPERLGSGGCDRDVARARARATSVAAAGRRGRATSRQGVCSRLPHRTRNRSNSGCCADAGHT